jgi:cytochrome P450
MAAESLRPSIDPRADQLVDDIFAATRSGGDPCPLYRQLREKHRCYYSAERSMWIVTGFAEADLILRSPAALLQYEKRMATVRPDWREHPASADLGKMIAFLDGDEHQKIRKALLPSWMKGEMERLRPALRAQAEGMVDEFVAAGGGSFTEKLARPMAEDTIYKLFAMDESTPRHLPDLIATIIIAMEFDVTQEQLDRADEAALEMREFWKAEYLKRMRNPGDDMLSALTRNPAFTVEEGTVIAQSLYNGGFDSTALTASTGMWLLLGHPEELERARRDPAALEQLPNEVLRMGGAIPMTVRVATADIPVGDQIIRQDDLIGLVLLAANRDPAQYEDPERFDLTRKTPRTLSLSSGVHACIGHLLARMELFELYRAMLQRTTRIEQVGEAYFRKRQSVRGIETLNLAVA